MLGFLKMMFTKENAAQATTSPVFGLQKALFVASLCVIGLCVAAGHAASDPWDALYRMVWLALCALPLLAFLAVYALRDDFNMRRALLFVTMLLAQMFVMLCINFLRSPLQTLIPDLKGEDLLLVMPYVLAPAVTAVMVNRRLGTYATLAASLLGLPLFPAGTGHTVMETYVLVCFLSGVAGSRFFSRAHKREQILYAGVATGAIIFVTLLILGCFHGAVRLHDGWGRNCAGIGLALLSTLGFNFLLAVIIGGLMPLLERLFNISTHITWLEWADMNHPILKKLQMSAPGTFHHSLCVQRLAEAAAEAIGADVTRAGVCALYHDIGKLTSPGFFAENIADQAGSPHLALTPEASARIIIGHVRQGIELALDAKLNRRIIDVIREHHGVSTAYFFYRKAMDSYEQELAKFEEGLVDARPEEVDKAVFSYKGPIPQTRESGIVSMADAVESATRSLRNPTEEEIRNMIESIFKGRILDGHLQDCSLTLGDIARMKESFFVTLKTMNHNRIAYPKPREEDATVLLAAKRQQETTKTE